MLHVLDEINEHWGWAGLKGVEIVELNEFGNLLVLDEHRAYWRICPEELNCEIVAENLRNYIQLIEDEDFQVDWRMSNLVEQARECLGGLTEGWVYYLVIPAVCGGRYDVSNFRKVPLVELIGHSGDWARAIKDLPDGAQIELRIIY